METREDRMRRRGYDPTCSDCIYAYAQDPEPEDEVWADSQSIPEK